MVSTQYQRRDLAPDPSGALVPDVLVAVCTQCGTIAALPPQSMPRINAARDRESVRIEARVPKELEDILGWIATQYSGRLDAFRGALIRYYLGELTRDEGMAARVKALAASRMASGRQDERFHLRLEKALLDRALAVARSAGVEDRSDVIRGLILAACEDAQHPSPTKRAALEALAFAAN
jgi:metal-responsive CopG/Arc/MetJ family transcriptional regulator